MSSLLKEAIVDAKALRESALKNAETIVIEKYSSEVKETLEKLLEQEDDLGLGLGGDEAAPEAGADLGADLGADTGLEADPLATAAEEPAPVVGEEETNGITDEEIPLAATDDLSDMEGDNLDDFSSEGSTTELTIDLSALQESLQELAGSIEEDEEIELTEEELADVLSEDEEELNEEEELEEAAESDDIEQIDEADDDEDVNEELDSDALVAAIMEKLTVDMGADLAGWAGRREEDKVYQMEKEMAHRRSTDVEEEMKDLKKAQEELVFENNQLTEKLSKYEAAISELKEGLQDTNLSNARLLYTNRVLRNTSLNERQKDKIVEAISDAGSVTEAKTIYDTLQSTVEAKPKRSPQSLSEAISRRSTVIRATREESTSSDPFQDRMKRLAGIK
jgi:DNA repair exonuclease SbcCD ATPase subunit